MFGTISYKTKQFFFVLIKFSLVVGAFYFIYLKLTSNSNLEFSRFVDYLNKTNHFTVKTIVFLVFLSVFNWFFEILKWQVLVSSFKQISFFNALEQSLGALTASLLTPNRIGEYGVKAMYFKPAERKRIVTLNLLGNSLQMLVTVLLGSVGLLLFIDLYNIRINISKIAGFVVIILLVAVIGFVVISKSKIRIKGYSFQQIKNYFKQIPFKIYSLGFLFALIRYAIFSFQFYYILTLFGVELPYFNGMVIISSMYVLASIVPSIFIFDVIIKGSVAIYLFTIINVSTITVLSTITLLWLLNIVFPSIFGSIFVLKFKFPRA